MKQSKIFTYAHQFFKPFLDVLYPPVCFLCEQGLYEEEERICSRCRESFSRIQRGDSVDTDLQNKFKESAIVERSHSTFLFEREGALQHALHQLKYEGRRLLGVQLGEETGRALKQYPEFHSADVLIPIPLHRIKYRERGYNQSEYICKGISSVTGIPVVASAIKRNKYTETQTKLSLEERSENMTGAFTVVERYRERIEGKTVILVDDVITTGSTILSCGKVLKENGAKKVFTASVAHAY